MPPVNPTTTSRLRVNYSGPASGTHAMLFHGTDEGSSAALVAVAQDFINALEPLFWDNTLFSDAEFAVAGSPLFFPVTWTPITADTANTFSAGNNPATFLQFGGRDMQGVRVKIYAFEMALNPNSKMRFDYGDQAAVDDAIDVLEASGADLRTISGDTPAWKRYANWGVNDYLTHRARRAG